MQVRLSVMFIIYVLSLTCLLGILHFNIVLNMFCLYSKSGLFNTKPSTKTVGCLNCFKLFFKLKNKLVSFPSSTKKEVLRIENIVDFHYLFCFHILSYFTNVWL